jgi:L-malate glycosyltransferase|tara:strand:+ start:376 stop:1530 length:1155 start_codon:yes stop_codon:yes gene_type:complete
MINKSICLISRSSYPFPISRHTQNMQTFEGWMRFWEKIVIISQCNSKKIQKSQHKRIYGVLLPIIFNKYLNVIYFTFFGLFEIRKLYKEYNFEIFQASDAGGAMLALIASKIYRKKFIFEVQGDIFDYPGKVGGRVHSSLVKYFSRILVKRADYIRIVSPFLYDPLDKLNIDRKKIFLIPPRCDSNLFNRKNIKQQKPEQFKANIVNLLFVGNLLIAKGVDILLEAFALILKENSNISLVYVGDGEEKIRLIERSIELGIKDKVVFFGKVEYDLVPSLMHYSDILILPSIEEGVGRVILEAMAMELPVIASNVGGIPLVIENQKDGLLFEVGDINTLKKHVLFLINNKSFSNNMSNLAYQKYISNYEYEVSMNKFLNMYRSIIK